MARDTLVVVENDELASSVLPRHSKLEKGALFSIERLLFS